MNKDSDNPYIKEWETMITPAHQEVSDALLKTVADRILSDTTYVFLNKKTGQKADEPGKWAPEDVVLDSSYNDWKYWNGVIHLAMRQVAEHLGDEKYHEYVDRNYSFAFQHLDFFKKQFIEQIQDCNFHQFFRLDRLDDFGAMAAAMLEHNIYKGKAQSEYLEKVANYISEQQDRLEDGTFCRRRFGITTIWADDLYMSVPFLVRMFKQTEDEIWLEDAILQSGNFHHRLFNEHLGLYHHCWYDNNQHGAAYWSRANGWVLMARINLLDYLPLNYPYRRKLIDTVLTQIVGLSRYQSPNGCWHQLIDKPDSFLETSGTAMFTYGIARAVNQGWIPDYYASIAMEGWKGLKANITKDGIMEGVSLGFNIRQDLPFYYHQPYETGGAHGLGAFLLAAVEISKLKDYRECVWC